MPTTVRDLEAGDREAAFSIIEGCDNISEEEKECATEMLEEYLSKVEQDEYLFIAATSDEGAIKGFLCYGPASLADSVYDIYWILIESSTRGEGVGTALLREAEHRIGAEGGRKIVAETSSLPSYEPARSFYEANGFIEEARLADFFKVGDDKIFYVKKIDCT